MKKVFIVSMLPIWSMEKGKGAPSLYQTLKGYSDNGFKVYYLTPFTGKNNNEVDLDNVEIITFKSPLMTKKTAFSNHKIENLVSLVKIVLFTIFATYHSLKKCKKIKPDIAYGFEIYGAPISRIIGKKHNIPNITRFMGTIMYPRMKQKNYRFKLGNISHIIGLKTQADMKVMTNDGTEGDKVLSELKADNNVLFLLNGINKENIKIMDKAEARKQLGINIDENVIITVSRLAGWKRLDRAIKVINEVSKHNKNIRLYIIGDGPERDKLEGLVKELNLKDNVNFVGALDHKNLSYYYSAADLFLSLYDLSNLGNPLIEALCYGKAVITLNNGGTSSINNGENFIMLDPNDIELVPNMVLDILNNNEKKIELEKLALDYANNNFWTWEQRMKFEVDKAKELL